MLLHVQLLALMTVLAAAGCANTPFYSEARDKQGQTLGKAVSQVELVSVVDELDKKFSALRQLEAETLKARQATNRDLEIARVASADSEGAGTLASRYVAPFLDRRLERLLGKVPTTDEMDNILVGLVDNDERDRQAASALRAFNAMSGLNVDGCAAADRLRNDRSDLEPKALVNVPAEKHASSKNLFEQVLAKCQRTEDASSVLLTGTGLLKSLVKMRDENRRQVEDYRESLQTQQKKLKEAQQAYEVEAKALQPNADDVGYRAQLTVAAERLKASIDALRNAEQPGQPGATYAHAEAIARLDALDNVLGALASGVSDPSKLTGDQRQAVALVRLIPSVADETDKLLKDAQRPRLGPLLLAKEQQRLAVEGFAAQLALLERKAATRRQQVEATRNEVFALSRARRALGPPTVGNGATVDLHKTIDAALSDQEQGGRRRLALYESFAFYFDHAQMYRAQQEALDLAANGVTDEVVMQQSRSAAQMWQSLMSNMATMLADYHAAGIKPADLAELLKGLGIFYIGYQAGK